MRSINGSNTLQESGRQTPTTKSSPRTSKRPSNERHTHQGESTEGQGSRTSRDLVAASSQKSTLEADQISAMLSRTIRRHRVLVTALTILFVWFLSDHALATNSLCLWCSSDLVSREWNLFYHLGGNGPWIPKRNGLGHPEDPIPNTCVIDQVHMLSRHAERYPTRNAGLRHLSLLDRLHQPEVELRGSLSFLNSWTYFTNTSERTFENLTNHGPYAGTLEARNTGRTFRRRYHHPYPGTDPPSSGHVIRHAILRRLFILLKASSVHTG